MLPSNEHTFTFKVVGERTKKTLEGSFTVKCILTTQEIIDVGLKLDSYNRGSSTLAPGVNLLNRAIAELEVRIIKAPSWWKDSEGGRDLLDTNIVYEVFNKALDAEQVYDKRISDAASEANEEAVAQPKKNKESKEAKG